MLLAISMGALAMNWCTNAASRKPVAQTAVVLSQQVVLPDVVVEKAEAVKVNPLKIICRSRAEALALASTYLQQFPDSGLYVTSGTPSMEPFIIGRVYVVVQYRPYDSIERGEVLVYMGRPDANKTGRSCMLHRAVLRDHGGWLMCGDNNHWSESWDRVTPVNYLGTAVVVLEAP
jgi:hypothetical protein